ncbi:MAG: lamin tail domain-containing protein, partial [Phycisphaerae bacterium]
FQINAGLRIRGGYSRSGDNPKHAFRLFFRWEYGEGKLHFPLFEDEGVDEFDHIDLRTAQNYCWSFNGDSRMTMSRDVFTRDNQGAMGQPYTRSRFYHLYINGQYWGIYQTEERPEADFAASYFGGRPEDYDVVKVEAGPYTINATDGDTNAWYRVYQAAQAGFASNEAYFKVQGLNPDGTPNPAYENLVDVDNLIDFNICTFYGGDLDGPISAFLGNNAPNNYYVSRDRTGRHGGFKSFKHDAEHTLLNVNEDRTGPYPAGSEFSRFNPQYLHQKLADNAEYRLRFADHVHKHFFNNGVLTPQAATQRFLARTNQIQMAIIAESARWGDSKVSTPLNRDDHWQPAVNTIVNSYLPNRTNVVLNQFKSKGWYPAVQAPQFNHYGGNVPNGFAVVMSRPAGQGGTIYYTTDGSDPRLIGGAVSGSASVYNDGSATQTFIAKGTQWRFLDDGSNQGTAWQAINFPAQSSWKLGNTQIGWNEGDEATVIPSNRRSFTTYYFRKSFQVPAGTVCTSLTANILRDDGAAVYLNATTPVTINMPASWTYQTPANTCIGNPDESTFFALPLAPANLVTGTNVLAVEVHQCPTSTSDLSFDLELVGVVQTNPSAVVVDRNMIVKARILDGGQWSALTEAVFLVTPANVVINEFMADNKTTLEDPQEPGEFPDWFELYNPNVLPVDLGGMYLSDDPANPTKYRIPNGVSIGPGQFVVFLADDDGTQGPLHANFKLNDDGEHVVLTAKDGTTVIDSISFGKQTADVAAGRYPDGGGAWGLPQAPTPGGANTPLR